MFILILTLIIAFNSVFAADNAVITDNFPALSMENPAYYVHGFSLQTKFYRPYVGIGTILYDSEVLVKYSSREVGPSIGLDVKYFSSDKYYKSQIAPDFGIKIGSFSVGIAPQLVLDGWKKANFHYVGVDNSSDPYFHNVGTNAYLSLSTGIIYDVDFIKVGLHAKNLLAILISRSGSGSDNDALKPIANLSIQNRLWDGILNIGFGLDMSAPKGKKINGAFGYTKSIGQRFSLMSSFDWCSMLLDLGLSINITKNIVLGYAFEHPFTDVGKVANSHKVCLDISIIPKPKIKATHELMPALESKIAKEIIREEPTILTREKVEEKFEKEEKLITNAIHFEFGKAKIMPDAKTILRVLGEVFERHPEWQIEIAGHTDSYGSKRYNKKLSEKRAKAVKRYLIETFNIDENRLIIKGYGESKPIATNKTPEGRALNRRVEFRIIKKEK